MTQQQDYVWYMTFTLDGVQYPIFEFRNKPTRTFIKNWFKERFPDRSSKDFAVQVTQHFFKD